MEQLLAIHVTWNVLLVIMLIAALLVLGIETVQIAATVHVQMDTGKTMSQHVQDVI